MTERLTIEKFKEIKSQLALIIKQAEESYEANKDKEGYNSDEDEQRYYNQYIELQSQLLSYDLSDIPFDEWRDIEIMSDENYIADFSKTNANIDFSIMSYSEYVNYKSCNIRNMKSINRIINSDSFDDVVVQNNPSLFISNSFGSEIKQKFYDSKLTIEDLFSLSNEQIQELQSKNIINSFESGTKTLISNVGLQKAIQLFFLSKDDYKMVYDISILMNNTIELYMPGELREKFSSDVQSCEVSKIKEVYSTYLKAIILSDKYNKIDIERLPEQFVRENSDMFLLGENIPEDLRERYYSRQLSVDDVLNNSALLGDIPISNFISSSSEYSYEFSKIGDALGIEALQRCIKVYPELFNYIIKGDLTSKFCDFVNKSEMLQLNQTDDVKQKLFNYLVPFFAVNNELQNREQLLMYDPTLFPLAKEQQELINLFGLENIKRFEQETGFFSHKPNSYSHNMPMLQAVCGYNQMFTQSKMLSDGMNFRDGTLSYEEFLNNFAIYLDVMRRQNFFTDYPDYNWMQGEFREKHPEIFIDKDAPEDLATAFYRNRIDPIFLSAHKEYIPYLLDKNLLNTIRADLKLDVPGLVDMNGNIMPNTTGFAKEYIKRYGNEKFLQLVAKYGNALTNLTVTSLNNEIENEQAIEKSLRNAIYNRIIKGNMGYAFLSNIPEFVAEHPEIFIDLSSLTNIPKEEQDRITQAFYTRTLSFGDIKKYPELATILKDKNLFVAFGKKDGMHGNDRIIISDYGERKYSDLELLNVFGNETFLELCSVYGRYMDGIANHINKDITIRYGQYVDFNKSGGIDVSFEEIIQKIEKIITSESLAGNLEYNPTDAPSFLMEEHPELFLNDDAPEELKNYFYKMDGKRGLTLQLLSQHKEWLPYLKDKAISTALLRNPQLKEQMKQYLELFGEEKAVKLGVNRTETVMEMLKSRQVTLMKSWYDKTGGKFIPDFVVMQNFRFEEADKFLASGANWSNLMKIKSFSRTPEARDAMLKLAYSFGAFDQDQRGFKRLQDLLTGIPKKIDAEQGYIFERMEQELRQYSQIGSFFHLVSRSRMDADGNFHRQIFETENSPKTKEEKEIAYNKMIEYIKNEIFSGDLFDQPTVLNFLESIKQENIDIDFTQNIFSQIYRKNDDGSYSLIINQQSCPRTSDAVREMLGKFREIPMMTPDIAHRYLGGFKMEYDDDFREFFLSNYDSIINDSRYLSQISSIQRRFKEIKAVYSNVNLTLDLAMSYIDNNKYENVNVGNERVVKVAALQNYSAQDFEMLQKIYNYGKQRTFSSIPRIESKTAVELSSGNYYYEILRLDDPRAMSIGFESDCCQRLGEPAELCMEHSMVDKNGRVFIITNENGEVVAQSWVWRNKDVLCFDNIEVPDQKMWDNGVPRGQEDSGIRNQFTDDILSIYKMVASELIIEDEKVYKELLESGKITQEQYNGLRLGKITTGLGYSNIKGSLKSLDVDKSTVSRPLPFEEPVKLSRGFYTSDSTTQYILEEREDRKEFDGETLPVHSDAYVEYTDNNFTEKSLLSLEKLEIVTKEDPRYLDTSVDEDADKEHLVTEIARNYRLNPETARIVMNPNFAIIYDVNGNELRIGDLLFNTKVDNNEQQMDIESNVVMQIRLALEQIGADKEINVSLLDDKQKEMYAKATGLTDELDIERGVGHAR